MKQTGKRFISSVAVPMAVHDFYEKKGKSLSEVLIEKYQFDSGNQLRFALLELQEAKENVLQLELNVVKLQENTTKNEKCSTIIFEQFRKERDIDNPTQQDRHWIRCKLEDNNIDDLSVEDFIRIYQNKKEARF